MQMNINNQQQINGYKVLSSIAQQKKSNIYLVEKKGETYALKIFHDTQVENNKRIKNELKSLKSINNSNVVQIIDDFIHDKRQCIIMEYCEGGTLLQRIKKQPKKCYPEKEAIDIFRELLFGLTAIHQQNLIHRNLKLENILFKDGQVKIGGFGISKELHEDCLTLSMVGTQQYLSPELAIVMPYNYKVDVWGLGILLFAMLFYRFPFGCHSGQYKQGLSIQQICLPAYNIEKSLAGVKNPQKISENVKDLLIKMFTFQSEQRITIKEVWEHPAIEQEYKCELPDLYQNLELKDLEMLMSKMPNLRDMTQTSSFIKKKQEEEDEKRMLQSSQQQFQANDDGNMLTSKLLAISGTATCINSHFRKHVNIYNFQIARYNLLIDQYQTLKDNMKFNFSLTYTQSGCFRYFILKNALFYMKWLDLILDKKINEFKLEDFDTFTNTQEYDQYQQIVARDIKKYTESFEQAYEDLMEYDTLDEKEIRQAVEPTIEVNYRNKYAEMPDGLKLPYRAVLMGLFGRLYDLSQRYMNQKEKLAIQINDMFEKKRFSQNEGKIRLRFCLRLLIASSINRLMEFSKFKLKTKVQQYEFIDYLAWLHKVENTEEEIEHIFTKYYPQFEYKKLSNYNFFLQQ